MKTMDAFSALQILIATRFHVEPEEVRPEARFGEDFGDDPIELAELFLAVGHEWAVRIPEEEADRIQTVRQLQEWIETHTESEGELPTMFARVATGEET
jgi:acyl carrier protein